MEDENNLEDQTGLSGETTNETTDTGQSELPVAGGLTAADAFKKAQQEYEAATGRQKTSFEQYMEEIQAAKKRLLAQPTAATRQEYLQGLAQTLTAPKERTDPRFYERQTLGTFLRDIGQYDAERKAAERKAAFEQAQAVGNLSQLAAKYQLDQATREATAAANLMGKLKPSTTAAKVDPFIALQNERDALNKQDPEQKNPAIQRRIDEINAYLKIKTTRAPVRDPADVVKNEMLTNAYTITNNPENYTKEQVQAAKTTIDRLTPPDVREAAAKKEGSEKSYQARMQTIRNVVAPDIRRAIDMIVKNPKLSAGVGARLIKNVPFLGQKATDLDNILNTIRSSVGFEKLEQLKRESPYGASGLGAVSNAEQRLLQTVQGSLEQDNSAQNLKFNLERLLSFYEQQVPDLLATAGVTAEGEAGAPAATTPNLQDAARRELEKRREGKK